MNSLASFPEGQSHTVAETGPNNDQIVGTVRGWPSPSKPQISTVVGSTETNSKNSNPLPQFKCLFSYLQENNWERGKEGTITGWASWWTSAKVKGDQGFSVFEHLCCA